MFLRKRAKTKVAVGLRGVAKGCTAAFHPPLRRGIAQLVTIAVAPGTFLDNDLGAEGEGVVWGFGWFCFYHVT